ncbi:MAG: class I SAM-dependent methyltransferase [Myxococcota bacterium]|nr:class I SAM-dependent methyltransferase [Myxococcota bacterium]
MTKKRRKKQKKSQYTAKTADKHILYEKSVQNVEADVEFLNDTFKKKRGRMPLTLREDFCGTAALCAEWVRNKPKRKAVGLDLDTETLAWGTKRNIEPLGKAAKRVKLLERNVMDGTKDKSDIVCAFNFSYNIFKDRATLLDYFKAARKGVKRGGALFLDIHGGSELSEEGAESKEFDGFTYVWDQGPFCAITNEAMRFIHFEFPDGTMLKEAFVYDWRFWGIPEVRDMLTEAGFRDVEVYWEGATDDGEGDGEFVPRGSAEQEMSWIAYVVAWV